MKDNSMHGVIKWMVFLGLVMALVGCQQAGEEPLPTQIDLEATNAVLAVQQTETAVAPTATSLRPTLPPTFTPTVEISPTATLAPTRDPAITDTPEGFNEEGTIYYIYNGDSIARLSSDGLVNEIIITFGVDQPILDLTASPDGRLLAFVAEGAGSAREVWVSNRDGSYLQKVSCLGYAEVRNPVFSADNNRLAFFAAPLPTTNKSLYVAGFAGSNDCPTGNNQQEIVALPSITAGDIAWDSSGQLVYYNDGGTFAYDFASNNAYKITGDTGFGSDFALNYNYETDQLAYLKRTKDLVTGESGGALVILEDADTIQPNADLDPLNFYAQSLQWASDNHSLLYTTENDIYLYDTDTRTRYSLVENLAVMPSVSFDPDTENFAYTDFDPVTQVFQIYKQNRRTDDRVQLTFNPEGTISDVLWLAG